MLSMTSDYAGGVYCPEERLRNIAEAGFTHVMWCHHWNDDFLYAECEIEQIARWLSDFGLGLTDVHASAGQEKGWASAREYERLAGVELVANRIAMARRLGTDVIVLHLPGPPAEADQVEAGWERIFRSLDALRPIAAERGVRIALENERNFDRIERVLAACEPEFVGLCYDCGHGTMFAGHGLDRLERNAGRVIAVHLHDNDGKSDLHKPPLSGVTDWRRLAGLLAGSSYRKWVSLEVGIGNSGIGDERAFLAEVYRVGTQLTGMIERGRR